MIETHVIFINAEIRIKGVQKNSKVENNKIVYKNNNILKITRLHPENNKIAYHCRKLKREGTKRHILSMGQISYDAIY